MVFLKLLFYHPYTICVKIHTNSCGTLKSLTYTIKIYVSCPVEVMVTPFYVVL